MKYFEITNGKFGLVLSRGYSRDDHFSDILTTMFFVRIGLQIRCLLARGFL